MNSEAIRQILEQVQRGELAVNQAAEQLDGHGQALSELMNEALVDLDRHRRCGFPEVAYCEGKSTAAILEVFDSLQRAGQTCFGTRISDEQAAEVIERYPNARHNPIARTIRIDSSPEHGSRTVGKVAVITAGTTDRPVAEEAIETLHWMECGVESIIDVGVAGPHRLAQNVDRFSDSDAVVVVAGMEGALPSVVGGWLSCPVIGVPTSVGYGAAFGGVAALLSMLNSCASNVCVVNIDAGFKAAYIAGMIAQRAQRDDCE